jgi:phosphoserine aminotransferase
MTAHAMPALAQTRASVLFFRSLRQAAGLGPRKTRHRIARPFAPRQDRQVAPAYCIDLMREVLQLPDTHRIGIVPGSDTGAFEMAMWTMLGARGVTALAWESFGEGWVTDAVKQLKLEPTVHPRRLRPAARSRQGRLVGRRAVHLERHHVGRARSRWRLDPDDREGLSFADATSAVFAYDIPWDKIDVATFSWQKVLGGEGGHGVLILGPRAVERLEYLHACMAAAQGVPPVSKGKLAKACSRAKRSTRPRCSPSKMRSSRSNGRRTLAA